MPAIKKIRVNEQLIHFQRVNDYISVLFSSKVHALRLLSISHAVLGVIASSSLAISMIGLGLSSVRGKMQKHAVKQIDRLMSNTNFEVWRYFEYWIADLIAQRNSIIVAMDWTEFDKDNQTTLALYLVTSHGRSIPLLWKTYDKSTLKSNRVKYEKTLLRHLRQYVSNDVNVVILADRGFGYVELYKELNKLGFDYVIRFKGNVKVYDNKNEVRDAKEWVGKNGRAKRLTNAKVTAKSRHSIPVVICVKAKKMKDTWCLVTNLTKLKTKEIINYYAKRWSVETSFRDQKNIRFGMGMYNIRVSRSDRRDRLFFIAAIAYRLLTLLGAASEAISLDKSLRANTVNYRTHSLFRQGQMLYSLIPEMKQDLLDKLRDKFNELLNHRKNVSDTLFVV